MESEEGRGESGEGRGESGERRGERERPECDGAVRGAVSAGGAAGGAKALTAARRGDRIERKSVLESEE